MSKFRAHVLELVSKIPRGKVTTYKELARALGCPKACRAVGNALARNPHPRKIPCHRVVRSDGRLGGYKFSLEQKARLLIEEGIRIEKGKIDLRKFMYFNNEI